MSSRGEIASAEILACSQDCTQRSLNQDLHSLPDSCQKIKAVKLKHLAL
jgi:hypothetical protein